MILDVLQIRDLVRSSPVQVGAASAQHRPFALGDLRRRRRSGRPAAYLDQAELDVVDRQRLLRLRVEAIERGCGLLDGVASAAKHERRPAAGDGDVERGFDLPQIGVERSAKVRERPVIDRSERELGAVRLQAGRGIDGRAQPLDSMPLQRGLERFATRVRCSRCRLRRMGDISLPLLSSLQIERCSDS